MDSQRLFALARKYGPWGIAFVGWLVATVAYVASRTEAPPGPPPVLPLAEPARPANAPADWRPGEAIYTVPPIEVAEVVLTARDLAAGDQRDWFHGPAGVKALHDAGITGEGVTVAVIDSGVDATHPDLVGQVKAAANHTGSPYGPADRDNHGTHVGGTIAAKADGRGTVGVAPGCKLLNAKALEVWAPGQPASGTSRGLAAAWKWARENGAEVYNGSFGAGGPDPGQLPEIQACVDAGGWVVVAAGNEGPASNTVGWPARYPETLAVAALDAELRVAPFSSRGPEVDAAAGGVRILATLPGGRYGVMSGTSMASPNLAGCLALVRGELKKRGLPIPKQADLIEAVRRTARKLPGQTPDAVGAGMIDPAALLADLAGGPVVPPPPAPRKETFTLDSLFSPDGRQRLFGIDPKKVDKVTVDLLP